MAMEHQRKNKPTEEYVSFLENYQEVTALFIFADIRGFGRWGSQYPQEIKELLEIEYSLARRFFDGSRKKSHRKKLVKLVGDGFFAANEVGDRRTSDLTQAFTESANDILDFVGNFNEALSKTVLHDKHEIGVGFGMSYGTGYRFNLSGFGTDYIGVQVNIASRLCSVANSSELVLEYNLGDYAEDALIERLHKLRIDEDTINMKETNDFRVYRVGKLYEELKKPQHYIGVDKLVTTIKKGRKVNRNLPKLF